MLEIMAIWVSCIMFIHLGLGATICDLLGRNIVIFKCVKCLTFQTILLYSLICTKLCIEGCVCIAFMLSYASLWVNLVLDKISIAYEKWYREILVSKKAKYSTSRGKREQDRKGCKEEKKV